MNLPTKVYKKKLSQSEKNCKTEINDSFYLKGRMLFVVENCHPKICDFTKIIRIVTKKFNFTNKNYFSCSRKKKFNEAVKTKKRLSRLELKKLIFNSLGTKKIEFDTKPTARKKKKRIVEVEMPHIENIKVENTAREFSTDSNNKESTPIDEVDIKYEEFDPENIEEFDPENQFDEFEPENQFEEFDPEGNFEEFEPAVNEHEEEEEDYYGNEIQFEEVTIQADEIVHSSEEVNKVTGEEPKKKKRKPRKPRAPPPKTEFHCEICGAIFLKKIILQSHFTRKHSEHYNFSCDICDKKFKVKGDLTTHKRLHNEPTAVCDVCGRTYKNSRYLYLHQRYAHFTTAFPCSICKRFMATQENLDQHIALHHTRKERVICSECGKSYSSRDTLKRHVRYVHNKMRTYECEVCSKRFVRRSELRQHLLIHTGKRHFACDICGQKFTQKPGLVSHRKKHPGEHPPLPMVRLDNALREFNTK